MQKSLHRCSQIPNFFHNLRKRYGFVVIVHTPQYHRLITSSSILPPVYSSSSGVFIDYPYYLACWDLAFSSLAGLCLLPRGWLCMEAPASHQCSCWHICITEPGQNGSLKVRGGNRLENPKAGKTLWWRGRSLTRTLSQGERWEDVFLLCQACSCASAVGVETFLFSSFRNGSQIYVGFLLLVHYHLLCTGLVNICYGFCGASSASMALILPPWLAKTETLNPDCGCW